MGVHSYALYFTYTVYKRILIRKPLFRHCFNADSSNSVKNNAAFVAQCAKKNTGAQYHAPYIRFKRNKSTQFKKFIHLTYCVGAPLGTCARTLYRTYYSIRAYPSPRLYPVRTTLNREKLDPPPPPPEGPAPPP